MTLQAATSPSVVEDPVGNILKWMLLAVAVVTFLLLGWATSRTYALAPPIPVRFVAPDGAVVLTGSDIVEGKAGFQRADLMDYGSLYGMGSYFGEDYTASELVKLAKSTEDNIAHARYGKPLPALAPEEQAAVRQWMRMPGDIVFALGALLMAWDFVAKLPPLLRRSAAPPRAGVGALPQELPEEAQ